MPCGSPGLSQVPSPDPVFGLTLVSLTITWITFFRYRLAAIPASTRVLGSRPEGMSVVGSPGFCVHAARAASMQNHGMVFEAGHAPNKRGKLAENTTRKEENGPNFPPPAGTLCLFARAVCAAGRICALAHRMFCGDGDNWINDKACLRRD